MPIPGNRITSNAHTMKLPFSFRNPALLLAAVALVQGCDNDDQTQIPPPPMHIAEWELDFEDNFDGTAVDTEHWNVYNSTGHNSNGLRHPSAYTLAEGSLVVTARMCPVTGTQAEIAGQRVDLPAGAKLSADGTHVLVSGGMAHRKEYSPGTKFEFRVRCEKDASNTMSAVMLTWPKSGSDRNARCEESDIYETGSSTGAARDRVSSFFHYGLHPDRNNGKTTQVRKDYAIDATEWHTMAFEWYTDKVYVFLDGIKVWTIIDPAIVPIYDHHLCIQLDAFGTMLASADATVRMYVDWVKIYVDKNPEE